MNKIKITGTTQSMLKAALAYSQQGLYIMPLHEPIFDSDGKLIGCTCETNKRSTKYKAWLESKGHRDRFNPDYVCPTPGKHPRLSDWETNASNDPKQIINWWHQWPTANIGLAVGKSGLITFDLDSYKKVYGDDSDLFTLADKQTVTQLSGGGGEHLVYQMPAGRAYTNAKGTLPAGVDIRGMGGMQVVAPSLHPSGRRYEWEESYSLLDTEPKPLPAALAAILDAAHATQRTAQPATFTTPTTEPPSLLKWHISKATRELINAPGTPGKRSETDFSVCLSLLYAGADDDDILAVFQHLPIGTAGKFAEAGPAYLARTIGKARTFMDAHPRPDVSATIAHMRVWIKTHNLSDCLPSKKIRPVFDAVLDAMQAEGQLTVTIGKKRLAALAGVAVNTAAKVLALLNGRILNVTPTEHGHSIELPAASLVVDCRFAKFDPLLNTVERTTTIVFRGGGQILQNDKNDYSAHKADDAFMTGTSRYEREHIKHLAQVLEVSYPQALADYTFAGLGEGVLLAYDTAARIGDMTAQDYAEATGLKLAAARAHLRRAESMGLATAEREGSRGPKVYTFAPDFWAKIDELTPNLRTFKLGSQRENKRLESAQQWAHRGQALANTPEEKQTFERRFAKLAKQRLPHLARLHPDLPPHDVKRLAYEVTAYKRSPQTTQAIYAQRTAQRVEHRETVAIIRDLAVEIADIGMPSTAVFAEIMRYGVFDKDMVKQVLQSSAQMADFETVESIKLRMLHQDFALALVPPVPVIDYQLRLGVT